MGRIAKNYFYNAAYQILVLLTPIITAPYLARVLGARNLGIYSYVNSSGNIVTTIALLGIYTYGNRQVAYVRENKSELTKTFWEIEFTRLILGTIGTVFYYVYARVNSSYTWYFLLYYPYILAQFLDCSWVYVGMEDMKPAVTKNFITRIINVIGIFTLVKDRGDLDIYIFMLAITLLAANISIYTQLPKYIGSPEPGHKSVIPHIKESVNLFLPQVASLFYLQVDKVMLKWLSGHAEQLSFYDQAEKIITIPLTLITVLSSVMMPRIANEYRKENIKEIQNLLLKAGCMTLFMAFPMMLGIFCIARQLVPWYLGSEFLASANGIMLLSPIVLFNSLAAISGVQYFTATNQINILMRAYVTAAVLNVAINALLIPKFGYAGAAAATVISSFISVVIQYYYLQKQIDLRRLWGYGFKYAVGSVIMMFVIFAVTKNMQAVPATTVLQIVLGGCIYLAYVCIIKDNFFIWMFSEILKKMKKSIQK